MHRIASVLFASALVIAIVSAFLVMPVSTSKKKVLVAIPNGAAAGKTGEILQKAGVIRSKNAFVLLARLTGNTGALKPGQYEFSTNTPLTAVLDKIVRGDTKAKWVTIPEGYTVRQIAELLEEKRIIDDADNFIRFALLGEGRTGKTANWPTNLEGYLFPDTYLLSPSMAPREVAEVMYSNFQRRVWANLRDNIINCGLSELNGRGSSPSEKLHAVITLASLIEREAKSDEDRALISGVLWNRLRSSMKLDVDATVQYARGKHKTRLLYKDLKIESDYNTYKRKGLPPGPIANPGLASIKAALNPADCPYYYYVAKPDGSHHFSRNLVEHNNAVAAVRAKRSEQYPQ